MTKKLLFWLLPELHLQLLMLLMLWKSQGCFFPFVYDFLRYVVFMVLRFGAKYYLVVEPL